MNERRRVVPLVKVSDNDLLMLVQTAELNAGGGGASIHQKQTYSALKELYDSRMAKQYIENIP